MDLIRPSTLFVKNTSRRRSRMSSEWLISCLRTVQHPLADCISACPQNRFRLLSCCPHNLSQEHALPFLLKLSNCTHRSQQAHQSKAVPLGMPSIDCVTRMPGYLIIFVSNLKIVLTSSLNCVKYMSPHRNIVWTSSQN